MKNVSEKLGQNLKKIQIDKNISQENIARTIKINYDYIINIENSKHSLALTTITEVAEALLKFSVN